MVHFKHRTSFWWNSWYFQEKKKIQSFCLDQNHFEKFSSDRAEFKNYLDIFNNFNKHFLYVLSSDDNLVFARSHTQYQFLRWWNLQVFKLIRIFFRFRYRSVMILFKNGIDQNEKTNIKIRALTILIVDVLWSVKNNIRKKCSI